MVSLGIGGATVGRVVVALVAGAVQLDCPAGGRSLLSGAVRVAWVAGPVQSEPVEEGEVGRHAQADTPVVDFLAEEGAVLEQGFGAVWARVMRVGQREDAAQLDHIVALSAQQVGVVVVVVEQWEGMAEVQ